MTSETEQSAGPASTSGRRPSKLLRTLNRAAANLSLPAGAILRPDSGALAVPDFRRFWYGMIVSNIGSWMQAVAQGWLILELTNSPFYLGLVGLVRAIPALTVTLFGGVLADRLDRRKTLMVTQSTAGLLAILLGLLDLTGLVTVWQILVIAFFSSVVFALDNPARQAMVPDLVGRENIASAVGLNSAAWNAATVIGPSLAGALVAIISTASAFILNGLSYFAVVYAMWKMQPRPQRSRGQETILQNLSAGLRFIAADQRIWGLMLIITIPTFFGRPYLQLMPIFARDVLHSGAGGYGILMAATGVGALAGAVAVGRTARSTRKGALLIAITLIFGLALLLFAASRWFIPSLLVLTIVGATQTLFMAIANTLLQLNVPEEMRGRVMSAYVLIPMGLMPLGSTVQGSIGDVIGVPLTVGISAVIVVVATLLTARRFPRLRRMS